MIGLKLGSIPRIPRLTYDVKMVPTARVSGEVRVGEMPWSKTGLTYYYKH